MKHLIFADGSSLGNPGPSGWGAVIVVDGHRVIELGGGKKHSTNNEMELTALIEAFDAIENEEGNVTIYTDSSYVINGATKWLQGWIKNDWITSTKTPVLHEQLWKQLDGLLDERKKLGKVEFVHVPGHSGVLGNERADTIANKFSAGDEADLYEGPLSEYAIDILNIDIDPDLHESRVHSKARAKMKAYAYVSKVDGKTMVHQTWAECERRVKGKRGALFQKVVSQDEQDALIKKWR
jgi:ribonuclease HI